MKIQISVSAGEEIRDLKKQIQLRTQYEKLQKANGGKFSRNKASVEKFMAWKKANPGYPQSKLDVLQKRLRALLEKKDPTLKVARKAGDAQKDALRKKLSAAERELDRLRDDLADANNKDYDYVPDDVDDVPKYKEQLKKNIKTAASGVSALRAKLKALK